MKYTFLLPAYKVKYLSKALQSILSQTYNNFEIIVSDDNSPEGVKEIVDSLNDKRIRYRRNDVNIGGEKLVDHWNLLVNECNSDYIIMASDDDIYHPNFLSEIDKLANNYPQIDIIRARVQRIDENGEQTAKEDIFDKYQTELETINSIFCGKYIGCIGNYVFRTKALKDIGGFIHLPYAWFSDLLTVVAMAKNGQANTANILFSFRLSECNISNTKKNKYMDLKKLNATIAFHKWMGEHMSNLRYKENKLNNNLFQDIIKAYTHRTYSQCGDYSWAIPFWKWGTIYNALKKNNSFSWKSFLKFFCIAIINRTMG